MTQILELTDDCNKQG